MVEQKEKLKKIRCEKCNSAQTYATKEQLVCRKCGYREQLKGGASK